MIPPAPTEPDQVWFHWPSIEWFVGAAWAVGGIIAGFLWRLSVKVTMLEHDFTTRDEATERRHQENLQLGRDLREQIVMLTERIDRLADKGWWRR